MDSPGRAFASKPQNGQQEKMMATTRAPFLSTKYGGYYHSQVPKEDDELTHVGPGTPGGEYLRRFWQPVCYADELGRHSRRAENPGRGAGGLPGFQRPGWDWWRPTVRTAARRWSSAWSSERGIRCCYHGWLFDVDGTILETPRGTGGIDLQGPVVPRGVSDTRILRHHIRLHGASGRHATLPNSGQFSTVKAIA